jgi:hypothetical protein
MSDASFLFPSSVDTVKHNAQSHDTEKHRILLISLFHLNFGDSSLLGKALIIGEPLLPSKPLIPFWDVSA